MGFRDFLDWTKAKLFGPSKKAREAAEEARRKIEASFNQTADLTDLRNSLRKEKTTFRRKANDAISGIAGATEEDTERLKAGQKPLSREEGEEKMKQFGWTEK